MARKRKSPIEQVASLEAKLEAAKARAIRVDTDNPVVADLRSLIESLTRQISTLSRNFSPSNPNSFTNRAQAFKLRIDEIQAQQEATSARMDWLRSRRDNLQSQLNSIAADIANNVDVPPIFEDNADLPEHILSLEQAFETAHNLRKNFKSSVTSSSELEAN